MVRILTDTFHRAREVSKVTLRRRLIRSRLAEWGSTRLYLISAFAPWREPSWYLQSLFFPFCVFHGDHGIGFRVRFRRPAELESWLTPPSLPTALIEGGEITPPPIPSVCYPLPEQP